MSTLPIPNSCLVVLAATARWGYAQPVALANSLPPSIAAAAEGLFTLVIFGLLFLVISLIWFGILNLRRPVMTYLPWLPLATALMGFIGFCLFSGAEINTTFLFFRTLFALAWSGLA